MFEGVGHPGQHNEYALRSQRGIILEPGVLLSFALIARKAGAFGKIRKEIDQTGGLSQFLILKEWMEITVQTRCSKSQSIARTRFPCVNKIQATFATAMERPVPPL